MYPGSREAALRTARPVGEFDSTDLAIDVAQMGLLAVA